VDRRSLYAQVVVEASKLKTLYDLAASPDEDVELVGGEIVRRPMTRLSHAVAQGNTRGELHAYTRGAGPGGWLIATDVSVAYEAHECPSHDLAGWRRERLPRLPQGIIDLPPRLGLRDRLARARKERHLGHAASAAPPAAD
jgi:Uma2 family endonuclease